MGLTMAEIMVLMIFALLLIVARVVGDGQTPETNPMPRPLVALVESWRRKSPAGTNSFDDRARDLIASAELGDAIRATLQGLREQGPRQVPGADEWDAYRRRAEALIALGLQAEGGVGFNSMGLSSNEAAQEFLGLAGTKYRDAQKSAGYGSPFIWLSQTVNQAEANHGQGLNGTDHPPCSATEGRPDLIYDVRLGSRSMLVHDNRLPEVVGRSTEWPTSRIRFDAQVSRAEFVSMTSDLFRWSVVRKCRFFVRVIDETLSHEKATYKLHLRTVEYHFYKVEPLEPRLRAEP